MQLTITVKGKDAITKKLEGIKQALSDLTPELNLVGQEMVRFFKIDVFESTGGNIGQNWQPLSYKYLERKQVTYPGKGILEASGTMRKSFSLFTSARQAVIRNTAPYAKYHQQPDGPGKGKMPQRKFMGSSVAEDQTISDIFMRSLSRRIESL